MAVGRLSDRARTSAAIWPGFVDAMTALLLVLMFVLSIFMLVQFVLRTQLTGQETVIEAQEDRIGALNAQLSSLSNVLAMEVTRGEELDRELEVARATLLDRQGEVEALQGRVASFEAQVASLLAERTGLQENVAALEAARDREIDAKAALDLALARAREEIDAGAEAARRAAAEREALEALIASLRDEKAAGETAISDMKREEAANLALIAALEGARDEGLERIRALEGDLSEEERLRLASLAAAEALRARLREADSELGAMTLVLEEKRREAEETLTLLAAAEAAREEAEAARADLDASLGAEEQAKAREAALLAIARSRLDEREREVSEQAKALALLNEQAAELRAQLGQLSAQLDASETKDRESEAEIANLGSRLNAALAREVQLKAREAERLKAEKESLEGYRSEFFGEMRKVLEGRSDIRVVGDRFIFQSEVLFATGSARLGFDGRAGLSDLAGALREVIARIPAGIDWLLVVEGHTDDVPISSGRFRDNWELSQARALSVVRFLTEAEGLPAERLAALGYGEFQPIDPADTQEARARNRRIELKFAERPERGE
ncbi:MAG: peptidoglycan -binding protein [Pikeienuella sp.]